MTAGASQQPGSQEQKIEMGVFVACEEQSGSSWLDAEMLTWYLNTENTHCECSENRCVKTMAVAEVPVLLVRITAWHILENNLCRYEVTAESGKERKNQF